MTAGVVPGLSGKLHLLRRLPPFLNGEPSTLEAFLCACRGWQQVGSLYGCWSRQCPRRADELNGGSVYFVHGGHIVFRLPFVRVQPVREFATRYDPFFENHFAIVCGPFYAHVEPRPVRYLRGFRYLVADDAPPDIPAACADGEDLPDALRSELRALGL